MKPKYAELTRIEFFKSADNYGMLKVYEDLYKKSIKNINVKNLIPMIKNIRNMMTAIRYLKSKTTVNIPGIDGQKFDLLLQSYSYEELHEIICKRIDNYQTDGVKKIYLEKKSGGRQLYFGYNAIDKIIHQMIKQILEPYCEGKFFKHSYGFRPTRNMGEALARCHHLVLNAECEYCVNIEIEDFYSNIHHNLLLKQIWNIGIRDKQVLALIRKILKSPVDCVIQEKGLIPDCILSPLLSNIVLNEMDQWIAGQWEQFKNHTETTKKSDEFFKELRGKRKYLNPEYNPKRKVKDNRKWIWEWKSLKIGYLVRYAEDIKIFTQNYKDARKWYFGLKQFIEKRLHLNINEANSKVVNLKKAKCTFQGFDLSITDTKKIKKKPRSNVKRKSSKTVHQLRVRVSTENIKKMSMEYKRHLKQLESSGGRDLNDIEALNKRILAWQNYCRYGTYPSKDLDIVYQRCVTKLNKLWKCSQVIKPVAIDEISLVNKSFARRYKNYHGMTWLGANERAIYPIWAVKQKRLAQRKPDISPFIKKDLLTYWKQNLEWDNQRAFKLIQNYCCSKWVDAFTYTAVTELFTTQFGKCPVSGLPLELGFEIHHIIPKSIGGSDEFKNLVMLNPNVHKLIHCKSPQISMKRGLEIRNLGGRVDKIYLKKLKEQTRVKN